MALQRADKVSVVIVDEKRNAVSKECPKNKIGKLKKLCNLLNENWRRSNGKGPEESKYVVEMKYY